MTSRKRLYENSNLCVIIDGGLLNHAQLLMVAKKAASGGADIIQYRDKFASTLEMIDMALKLNKISKRFGSSFIINDRIEVAMASGADGVHIGRADPDYAIVRSLAPHLVVGVSVSDLREAKKAKADGADYIGVGPVFSTPIKPRKKPLSFSVLRKINALGIPAMLIGGITVQNVTKLVADGFRSIAVIRSVCKASNPYRATKELKVILNT